MGKRVVDVEGEDGDENGSEMTRNTVNESVNTAEKHKVSLESIAILNYYCCRFIAF